MTLQEVPQLAAKLVLSRNRQDKPALGSHTMLHNVTYQLLRCVAVDSQTKCKFFIKTEVCMEDVEWVVVTFS